MNKLRVAVIGCGAVSKNHGKAICESQKAELCYCVDIDNQKAVSFSKQYGGIPLSDYTQLFEKKDIDVIHVVTPHFTHSEIAIDCMEHGIDVFCEKPLAIHVSDGKKVIETSKRTGKKIGICFQNRLNDSSVMAKRIIEELKYGKVISAAATVRWDRHGDYYSKSPWRGKYETEGAGCIINQAIHTIDLMQYLVGGIHSVCAVDAHLRNTNDYEVEDSCMANFTFIHGGNAVGYFTNCATGFKTAVVEIVLEKARIRVEQKGLEIQQEDGTVQIFNSTVATGEKSEWGVSHGKMIEAFYDAVLNNTQPPVTAQDALESIKIIAAIQRSKGKEIIIN